MRMEPGRRTIPELGVMGGESGKSRSGLFSFGRFEENVRQDPKRQRTHRHGFHELMIFEEGRGQYSGDFESVEVIAPTAIVIPAGTVHWWPQAENLRGAVCGFDLEFLRLHGRMDEAAAVLLPPLVPMVPLDSGAMAQMSPWLERMGREWLGDGGGRLEILRACLTALLVDVRRQQIARQTAPDAPHTAVERIYIAFLDELEKQVTKMPSARDLANALRMTPDHLSASLREACGRNAGDLIAERVMLEAKRLLAHSRLGVAEAAYALGFESPSYFTRFFRKHASLSPKEFRERENL